MGLKWGYVRHQVAGSCPLNCCVWVGQTVVMCVGGFWCANLVWVGVLNILFFILVLWFFFSFQTANNTAISQTFENIHQSFSKIFKRRAHVHHYTEYMEEEHFFTAEETLKKLIFDYNGLEQAKPSSSKTRITPIL